MSKILIEGMSDWLPCSFTLRTGPDRPAEWSAEVQAKLAAGDQPKVIISVPFGYLLGRAVVTRGIFSYGVYWSDVEGDRGLAYFAEAGAAMEHARWSGGTPEPTDG